jgi:hypothetical protein
MEAHLLLKEIDDIIARVRSEERLQPCLLDESGDYCCPQCCETTISDGPFFCMDGPTYCAGCDARLEYVFNSTETAAEYVDWLYSLLQREIPIPEKHWVDLKIAAQGLPIPHKSWENVAYVVHLGVSVDHLLSNA